MSVPRTGTGILAEKAKACWANLAQGNRQISPVCSLEGVPVFCQKESRSQ